MSQPSVESKLREHCFIYCCDCYHHHYYEQQYHISASGLYLHCSPLQEPWGPHGLRCTPFSSLLKMSSPSGWWSNETSSPSPLPLLHIIQPHQMYFPLTYCMQTPEILRTQFQITSIQQIFQYSESHESSGFPAHIKIVCCVCLVAQSCLTLCNTIDWGPPGFSVHGILQAGILEWVAMPSSRGSSQPRNQTQVFHIAEGFFTVWATREAHIKVMFTLFCSLLGVQ